MLTGAFVLLDDGSSPGAPERDCVDPDDSYTSDSLHDVRSFADAMAIVRGVRQTIPPEPDGPEGWAGLIGRRVTMRVQRVLWRRPHAPEPPRRFTFDDLGWSGTLDDRRPLVACGDTRIRIGRRYLAPVVRDHGEWYPFPSMRLRLRGHLVVGDVDGGEPGAAHAALAGRTVRGAVRVVAQTLPYRTTVLHPRGGPTRRWRRAYEDDYRLWGDPNGYPVIVESGVTRRTRWQLYLRLPARGGMCVGMALRPRWGNRDGPSGEGCGPRTLPALANRIGLTSAAKRGVFADGHTGAHVYAVRVRFDGDHWREVPTVPTPDPPGGSGRFWVVPARGACAALRVQAIGPGGEVVDDQRLVATYAACRSG